MGIGRRGRADERVVVRLPPLVPSFPEYELHDQAAVLGALAASTVPVPEVVAVEDDAAYLGVPFLVMSFVAGRPGAEAPALDPELTSAPVEHQRKVHTEFLSALARLHRIDWHGANLDRTLRTGVRDELAYWARYIDWASAPDDPPRDLAAALRWCVTNAPGDALTPAGTGALLWGDARLGNVMFSPDASIVALLDWELATIGPPEMDLAWYLVLDELTTRFVGARVPGFLERADAIAFYERELGRAVATLAWHEIFALVRSIAITDRQARLAARAGTPYPGVAGDANPLLRALNQRISRFDQERDAR